MTLFERFKTGINLASASFTLINRTKRLLLYTFIPLMVEGLFFIAIGYQKRTTLVNLGEQSLLVHLQTFSWYSTILLVLTVVCINFITTFFAAALIHHATRLIRAKGEITLRKTLTTCLSKWRPLLQWTILTTLISTLIELILLIPIPQFFIVAASLIAHTLWAIASFLVLVFIILEPVSVLRAVALSWTTTKNNIVEFFGGLCWIAIVAVILINLSILAALIFILIPHIASQHLLYLQMAIVLPFAVYLYTVYLVFAALFYDTYFERPIEELALAQYDLEL